MIIFETLAVYGFTMAQSPPKLLARFLRADLLALLCVVFSCILSLFHMMSRVSCGTKLYRFLGFVLCFTFILGKQTKSSCRKQQCLVP